MRGLTLPVVAILAGIVLVVGGGYLAFRDDGGGSSPKVDVSVPGVTINDPVTNGCPDVRLTDRRKLFFKAYRSKGDVTASVTCLGGVSMLSFDGRIPSDFDVWLYNNRDDAKDVGSVSSLGGQAFGEVTLPDSSRYISIALVSSTRRRPAPIGFQAQL